jgi:hypothetical protein
MASPQVSSALDAQATSSTETTSAHDETQGPSPPISITMLPHLNQTALTSHDIVFDYFVT